MVINIRTPLSSHRDENDAGIHINLYVSKWFPALIILNVSKICSLIIEWITTTTKGREYCVKGFFFLTTSAKKYSLRIFKWNKMSHHNRHGWFFTELHYKHVSRILTNPWRFTELPSHLSKSRAWENRWVFLYGPKASSPSTGNSQGKFQGQGPFSKNLLLPFTQNLKWGCNSCIIGYVASQ